MSDFFKSMAGSFMYLIISMMFSTGFIILVSYLHSKIGYPYFSVENLVYGYVGVFFAAYFGLSFVDFLFIRFKEKSDNE